MAEVKSELYYRNDTVIIYFFAANKIALASSNAWLENSGFNSTRKNQILLKVIQQLSIILGDSDGWVGCRTRETYFWSQIKNLETQNGTYFFRFSIWNSFEIINPFSWVFNTVSSEKCCPTPMPFLLTCIWLKDSQFVSLNPDWPIQISGAPAKCKDVTSK